MKRRGEVGQLRLAEFFAGIGLVRAAFERAGWDVVFANDIEPFKRDIYAANFGDEHFRLGDIRSIPGCDVPDVELATASFPCTDLSLAGTRRGLAGSQSGMFWEFARILEEMGSRRPPFVLIENVPSFATSKQGTDFTAAIERLNQLGYACGAITIDAQRFVPQSRERLFVIGSRVGHLPGSFSTPPLFTDGPSLTPKHTTRWLENAVSARSHLDLRVLRLPVPQARTTTLADIVERMRPDDDRWWSEERLEAFVGSLSQLQSNRLRQMENEPRLNWATAYRRTRQGRATWEIRNDGISGCLRTARGGSSRQAVVEAGRGVVRVRWMTAREYARLQGAPDFIIPSTVSENQALSGFGDAVALPAVEWLAREYITPLMHSVSVNATA